MSVIVITGASSGFGALTARALARAGHTVYAGMRATADRNAPRVAELVALSDAEGVDIRGVEMDVQDQISVDAAIARIIAEQGRLDVVIHNAGHMVLGPLEAFTPEQLAQQYDVNVLSTQRVNRAALPHLRAQGSGHLVWVASSSTRGAHPPFLAPYFAAKAGMDTLAESYAAELIKFGIDTTIVVPGAFTSGTNHFANSGAPADAARAAEYDALYGELRENMAGSLAAIFPEGARRLRGRGGDRARRRPLRRGAAVPRARGSREGRQRGRVGRLRSAACGVLPPHRHRGAAHRARHGVIRTGIRPPSNDQRSTT